MLGEYPEEQVRDALDEVAREILAQGDITHPPVDALRLAKRLGLVVARGAVGGPRAQFVRLGGYGEHGQPTILLADDPRHERRQWAVAHELGENYSHRVFQLLGVDEVDTTPTAREDAANRLAGCVLLPRQWFAADGAGLDWDLLLLKDRYATASHELIARRMLEMPPGVIVTVADQGKPAWRRSNRLQRTPPLTDLERAVWQRAHQRGEPAQGDRHELPEGIDDVRAWAIHEPDWRREIIRTALVDQW